MAETPTPDDATLIMRCRQADAAAWRLLVQKYQRLVYAVARRAGLDEHAAADVFQTVFQRLLQALPRLQQPERLQAWIVTTAKRETLLQRRRSLRTLSLTPTDDAEGQGPAGPPEPADPSPLPESQLEELQQLHLLRLALDRLDTRCHSLLSLLFADAPDRPAYEQIALQLAMPVGSIGPTRARCLAKLRALLAAEAQR